MSWGTAHAEAMAREESRPTGASGQAFIVDAIPAGDSREIFNPAALTRRPPQTVRAPEGRSYSAASCTR